MPFPLPPDNVAEIRAISDAVETEENLDRASEIMRAAVTYTSRNGASNGAWIAEHTGDSTVPEIVTEGICGRRDATS
jgi:hypothetical protein